MVSWRMRQLTTQFPEIPPFLGSGADSRLRSGGLGVLVAEFSATNTPNFPHFSGQVGENRRFSPTCPPINPSWEGGPGGMGQGFLL
ncbi:MAG: hypothetical protein EHM70_09515 [Chloroflexota bacterium]|nr:MAG: hypothetical protein EHM70_09515 [Chloroflexota bacterium]